MRCCSPASQRDTPRLLSRGMMDTCRESIPAPPPRPRPSCFLKSPARYASRRRTKTTTRAPSRTRASLQHFISQVNIHFLSDAMLECREGSGVDASSALYGRNHVGSEHPWELRKGTKAAFELVVCYKTKHRWQMKEKQQEMQSTFMFLSLPACSHISDECVRACQLLLSCSTVKRL